MELQDKIARYQEIERRGLLSQLPPEKQAIWAEIKNRGLVNNEQPQQDPYSGLDKAKYTLRAAGEGATFGLGDLVAGSTNVLANDLAQATHGQGLMGKLEGASNFGKHILVPFSQLWDPNLKKGRNEFVREQARFTEAHPGLNFTGELVGGLVTGVGGAGKKLAQTAGKQGIKALAKEGAREGTKFGALYGAGSGATQNEGYLSGKDALIGAGIGAASGAVLGYAVPPVVAGVGRIAGIVKPGQIAKAVNPGQVAETVENTANNVALKRLVSQNPELVEQSIKEGTPLINIADRKLFRTTRGAVSTNPEAEQILSDYARKFNSEKAGKVENLINQQLGEKSSAGAIQDILDEGRMVYQPIYDEVMKAGDLQIPIKNQRVLNAFSEVLKDYPELDKLPATDIRVLDLVKQKLDDKIGVAVRQGENNKARMLLQAKNELIGQMDAKVPQYAEARKAFKAMKDLEELVSQGQNVKQLGREELAQLYQKTAPEERGAIRAGIRDVLIRDLDRINSEGANSVKKVFSNSMLGKLKRIGLSDDKIAQAIAKEDLANSNIQGVFGGSNTAQKIADILNNTQGETSLGRAIFQPARTAKRYGIKAVDYLVNKIQNSSPAETARLMTDPAYLKSEYERLYGGINKIVKGGNKGKGGIVDAIGNKLKEEGGYAMKPLDDTQMAYHGSPVKGIKQLDTAFMGTGEGPQAHGWGTYLAGTPETGERYRLALTNYLDNWQYDGKPVYEHIGMKPYMMSKAATKKDVGSFKETLKNIIAHERDAFNKNDYPSRYSYWDDMYKKVSKMDDSKLSVSQKGQLYEVKIPKNDVLLDEQKPFNQQPPKVQEALKKMAKDNIDITKNYSLQEAIDENLTGGKIYNLLEMDLKNTWRNLGDKSGADPAEYVSKGLNEYGIKGITYDGRQDGRSFVIFDPMKDTKINRTFYSVLAALASAGLLNDKERK